MSGRKEGVTDVQWKGCLTGAFIIITTVSQTLAANRWNLLGKWSCSRAQKHEEICEALDVFFIKSKPPKWLTSKFKGRTVLAKWSNMVKNSKNTVNDMYKATVGNGNLRMKIIWIIRLEEMVTLVKSSYDGSKQTEHSQDRPELH